VALLFSSFSSPSLSALLTFFVFIIGHFSADLKTLASSTGTTSARYFFAALYYLLPNFSNYSFITPAAHGQTPAPANVAAAAVYAALYITILLTAATLIFNRRNFK
jgi:ABC-type transport system involved in multi-copper enzyme maturation permease subunit